MKELITLLKIASAGAGLFSAGYLLLNDNQDAKEWHQAQLTLSAAFLFATNLDTLGKLI
jgi:hypothetical protein